MRLLLILATLSILSAADRSNDDQAIKDTLTQFYDGWNAHDVEKMTAIYAVDVDHINTYGEWRKSRDAVAQDLREGFAPSGRLSNSKKTFAIEKVRYIKPDVAVVQVRSLSKVGNIGTYVMTKTSNKWLVVSFTNVGYELKPGAGKP